MTLEILLLVLAFLAALLAAFGAWRTRPAELEPELLRRLWSEELARLRRDLQGDSAALVGPVQGELARLNSELASAREAQLRQQAELLAARFGELRDAVSKDLREGRLDQSVRLDALQGQVGERLEALQKGNDERLEKIRQTVDEKLHETLEKRLGESFALVSTRLEEVQRGLGEMQGLAQDVGGLKRALTNVKTRGVIGEAQLGALLEQFLAPGQYQRNVKIRPRSNENVEYAVKLPGAEDGGTVWLPVDAKFPIEDYQRLMEGYEVGDPLAIEASARALELRILAQAREIRDKYIAPPYSTDFALLFLPFEGLYAEALRRPGLLERVQRECKVTFVGPTTLTAFLNSLQVGFRTLAISKRSAEVWKVLGAVKTEFGKFGETLGAVQKKLDEASTRLGDVAKRRDMMERRLASVETEELAPAAELPALPCSEEDTPNP
jgi:DNA recombination protein RmuC